MSEQFISEKEIIVCKVRRAISDLRAGYFVRMHQKYLIISAETITQTNFNRLKNVFKGQVTLFNGQHSVIEIPDTFEDLNSDKIFETGPFHGHFFNGVERTSVMLLKLAQLLPMFFLVDCSQIMEKNLTNITHEDILIYKELRNSEALQLLPAVNLPLKEAKQSRFYIFRSKFDGTEYYALVIGDISQNTTPCVRIHSSCYTGDLLNSLQCDCNSQLQLAIRYMNAAQENSGILIYLPQEGRGIGLANKIRTYDLQAKGYDTVEANKMLGFEADERDFTVAAKILKTFQVSTIQLLTNNPHKVNAIEAFGIQVMRVLPLTAEINQYNKTYLETKKQKMGHIIQTRCPKIN